MNYKRQPGHGVAQEDEDAFVAGFLATTSERMARLRTVAFRIGVSTRQIPVSAGPAEAAIELREYDPRLFEYVVEHGLGILACRRAKGRSFDVSPVHWPRKVHPDPIEKEEFIERHREVFEEAGILAKRSRSMPRVL